MVRYLGAVSIALCVAGIGLLGVANAQSVEDISAMNGMSAQQMNAALIASHFREEQAEVAQLPAYFPKSKTDAGTFPPDIQKILNLPEDQIDTGVAALTFAKEIYPNLDVVAYSSQLNDMARHAKATIERFGKHDPISVIQALNTYYHFEFRAQYDFAPDGRKNRDNYFLNRIMDRHMGQCETLPMLYMAIAQRLGYPVYAVHAPEHSFLRYVDPSLPGGAINIEVSGRQISWLSNAGYAHWLNINDRAIRSGAFLRTLTRRQWLGLLLEENAVVFSKAGYWDRAILYVKKAQELDPQDPYYPKNLAQAYEVKAQRTEARDLAEKYMKMSHNEAALAESMGWVNDPDALTRADAMRANALAKGTQ